MHSIKLTLSDYQDYQQQVRVEANQTTELEINLVLSKPEFKPVQAKKRSKWPWIGGGLAVVIGASVTAYLFTTAEDETVAGEKTADTKRTTLNISVVIP